MKNRKVNTKKRYGAKIGNVTKINFKLIEELYGNEPKKQSLHKPSMTHPIT